MYVNSPVLLCSSYSTPPLAPLTDRNKPAVWAATPREAGWIFHGRRLKKWGDSLPQKGSLNGEDIGKWQMTINMINHWIKSSFLSWFSHSFQTKETAPAAEPLAKLLAQGRWAGWPGKASCLTSITWDRRHMGHDWGVTHKSRCPWMMLDGLFHGKSEHKMDDLGIPLFYEPYLWNQLKIHMQKPLLDELF